MNKNQIIMLILLMSIVGISILALKQNTFLPSNQFNLILTNDKPFINNTENFAPNIKTIFNIQGWNMPVFATSTYYFIDNKYIGVNTPFKGICSNYEKYSNNIVADTTLNQDISLLSKGEHTLTAVTYSSILDDCNNFANLQPQMIAFDSCQNALSTITTLDEFKTKVATCQYQSIKAEESLNFYVNRADIIPPKPDYTIYYILGAVVLIFISGLIYLIIRNRQVKKIKWLQNKKN